MVCSQKVVSMKIHPKTARGSFACVIFLGTKNKLHLNQTLNLKWDPLPSMPPSYPSYAIQGTETGTFCFWEVSTLSTGKWGKPSPNASQMHPRRCHFLPPTCFFAHEMLCIEFYKQIGRTCCMIQAFWVGITCFRCELKLELWETYPWDSNHH